MAIDCVARFADLRPEMLLKIIDWDETPYTITTLIDLDLCEHDHRHDESCPPCFTSTQEAKCGASSQRRSSLAGSEEGLDVDSYCSTRHRNNSGISGEVLQISSPYPANVVSACARVSLVLMHKLLF